MLRDTARIGAWSWVWLTSLASVAAGLAVAAPMGGHASTARLQVVAGQRLGPIRIGQSQASIEKKLGKPIRLAGECSPCCQYAYDGTVIEVCGGSAVYVTSHLDHAQAYVGSVAIRGPIGRLKSLLGWSRCDGTLAGVGMPKVSWLYKSTARAVTFIFYDKYGHVDSINIDAAPADRHKSACPKK